jgi:hypothetical protein
MLKNLREQKRYRTTKIDGEYVIVGKRGQVSLYADGDLDIWITNVRKANKALLIWKARSTYDDGACFVRPQADLGLACQLIQARKRRLVTEAMRQRGRELAHHLHSGKKTPLQGSILGPKSSKAAYSPFDAVDTPPNHEVTREAQP